MIIRVDLPSQETIINKKDTHILDAWDWITRLEGSSRFLSAMANCTYILRLSSV